MRIDGDRLKSQLPPVRGRLQANADMSALSWFRVGGPAEILFTPADEDDLAEFLGQITAEIPVMVVGVGSNLLIRDGGIPGIVIRLGRGFGGVSVEQKTRIRVGAAVPDMKLARFALDNIISGLTFLRGIPGTIGGALRMNGGAYEREIKDVLIEARAVDRKGHQFVLSNQDMKYSYRHCGLEDEVIFTQALLQGEAGNAQEIAAAMDEITSKREESQPVKSRTGGSTFKNPPGQKSWQLIDAAGLRGFSIGPAKVSDLHCNFLINEGGATAAQIEELGETVRARVQDHSGVILEWEIKRIGIADDGEINGQYQ